MLKRRRKQMLFDEEKELVKGKEKVITYEY